jgi:hypothetical protein
MPNSVYRDTLGLCGGLPGNYWFTGKIALTAEPICATVRCLMEGHRGNSETGAIDVARTLDLVERVMQDVDSRSATEIETLLTDLLCAVWPTPVAQCQ